jgi:polyvinyl alcohol dehydrogenase (cytochrome)
MGAWRLGSGTAFLAAALAAVPDGAEVYKLRCAACHDHPTDRVPTRDTLAKRSPEDVVTALTSGAMREHGKTLNDEEKRSVARFVTGKEFGGVATSVSMANPCPGRPAPIALNDSNWNGWGRDLDNSRYQPAPGIAAADVPKLKVKWSFGYPGTFTYGQPTLVGDRLYVTSGNGTVFALNAQTGCTYWTFKAGASTRTAISVGPMPANSASKYAAYFGDDKATVYAVNAEDGALLWSTRVDDHPVGRVTGAPVLHKDGLYVPVSSIEEAIGVNPKYECCKFQGSVVRLDAATGKLAWKTHTMPDPPAPWKKNSAGTQLYGPAGAAVWSAPTIDLKRKAVYVGTGNSYTDLEQTTANAIVAFDLETGSLRWASQVTSKDNFLMGCGSAGVNCPAEGGPDADFGSSPVLRTLPNGKQVLLAGQKSGAVLALDPDHRGRILWQEKVGAGSALGGVEWGFAADNEKAYIAIADTITKADLAKPGITALNLATGARVWSTPAPKVECTWGKSRCLPAQSQAVTVIPGVVFSGSMDGHLRGYATGDGYVVWDFDTGRPFETVNGVKATGGSLDAGGATGGNGFLYVNSGYGRLVGQGGNVLLAFSVDGR